MRLPILTVLVFAVTVGGLSAETPSLKEKKAKVVGSLQKLGREAASAKAGKKGAITADTRGPQYAVMLINSTDNIVRMVRVNQGKWQATPLIGRTCASIDYEACYEQKAWAPLLLETCGHNIQVDA